MINHIAHEHMTAVLQDAATAAAEHPFSFDLDTVEDLLVLNDLRKNLGDALDDRVECGDLGLESIPPRVAAACVATLTVLNSEPLNVDQAMNTPNIDKKGIAETYNQDMALRTLHSLLGECRADLDSYQSWVDMIDCETFQAEARRELVNDIEKTLRLALRIIAESEVQQYYALRHRVAIN